MWLNQAAQVWSIRGRILFNKATGSTGKVQVCYIKDNAIKSKPEVEEKIPLKQIIDEPSAAGSNYFKTIAQSAANSKMESTDEFDLHAEYSKTDDNWAKQSLEEKARKFSKSVLNYHLNPPKVKKVKQDFKLETKQEFLDALKQIGDEMRAKESAQQPKSSIPIESKEMQSPTPIESNKTQSPIPIESKEMQSPTHIESKKTQSPIPIESKESQSRTPYESKKTQSPIHIESKKENVSEELTSQPSNWSKEIENIDNQLRNTRFQKPYEKRVSKSESQREEFVKRFKKVKPAERNEINQAEHLSLNKKEFQKVNSNQAQLGVDSESKLELMNSSEMNLNHESQIEILKNSEIEISKPETNLTEEEKLELDIEQLRPAVRPVVYNLAYFVNENVVLQKFIEMGVMIRKWDEDREIGEFVNKLDLEKDVKPRLIFLHDIKIPPEKFGFVITKNPMIFKKSLDDLFDIVNYLSRKQFDQFAIRDIVCHAPKLLTVPVTELDTRLGWLQKEFDLQGSELRDVVISRPKLVTLPHKIISDVKFFLKDFLSFNDATLKHFMKTYPKLFTKDFKILEANYNYITQVLKLNNEQILSHPPILQVPLYLIKTRYSFLKSLNRVQFDPTLPNFISVKNMIQTEDKEFIHKYAKSSLQEFQKFLKTI